MNEGSYPALHTFVMKGVTTKAKAREALNALEELVSDLENWRDEMTDALDRWEEGEDGDERAEGKEALEQVNSDLDECLTNAGRACGMADYEPADA